MYRVYGEVKMGYEKDFFEMPKKRENVHVCHGLPQTVKFVQL